MDTRARTAAVPATTARTTTRRRELTHNGMTWLDLIQPAAGDISYARERFGLDALALDDLLAAVQRPRAELQAQGTSLLLIMHIPGLDRDGRVIMSEIDVIVGRDFVVSVHDGTLKPLRRLFAAAAADEPARAQLMGRGPGYLCYRIVDTLIKHCFPLCYQLADDLERLDGRLFDRKGRTLIRDLNVIRRDLITLQYMLAPDVAAARALTDSTAPFLRIDTARYFGACAEGLAQLTDMISEQQAVIGGLQTTLDSLTLQRVDRQARVGSLALLALLPLALLAALAGLDVVAPFNQHLPIFVAVAVVVPLLTILVLLLLQRRGWL